MVINPMSSLSGFGRGLALVLLVVSMLTLSVAEASGQLVVYSGRSRKLVEPVIQAFEKQSGITVQVRYGGTAQLALALAEEGDRSPADVFWAQESSALEKLASENRLVKLDDATRASVPVMFRSPSDQWIATSGRARVLAFSPSRVAAEDRPESVLDLTNARWRGRVGWAPSNASFQAFVTAMRAKHGDERTRAWIDGMVENQAKAYPANTPIIDALAAGEIDLGITNHYYLLRFLEQDPEFPVDQKALRNGDVGNLISVAAVGVLKSTKQRTQADRLVRFLLSDWAQAYFAREVFEYPVVDHVAPHPSLQGGETLRERAPKVNLEDLDDLPGTLKMLREAGLL